ncbi:hypothetical protein M9H77_35441 [Catharanthus roseus]|uniref:Uncharacterized protein n=1 Tax=Catharanthus roseus TaxID=4058 RepID=A0ACB9ZRK6_CATRO|nr:hypothetical protein M9H77_35441 [Catharanthus roseus]
MIVALLLFCFWFCTAVTIVVIGAYKRERERDLLASRLRDPLAVVSFLSPAPQLGSWTLAAVRCLHWLSITASTIGSDSAAAVFQFCLPGLDRRLRRKREDYSL